MSGKDLWLRFGTGTHARKLSVREMSVGSFSNDDGGGNKNVKKAIGLLSKTTSLHVHDAFLYISLLLLYDYDVKLPSFTFYDCLQLLRLLTTNTRQLEILVTTL